MRKQERERGGGGKGREGGREGGGETERVREDEMDSSSEMLRMDGVPAE